MQWVLFLILSKLGRPKQGILAAIVSGFLLYVGLYAIHQSFDLSMVIEVGLIGLLGALSLKTENPTYFKLQPALVGAAVATILCYFQFFDIPVSLRYQP